MGMFDKPKYLTGPNDAYASPGDTFFIHNAKVDGTVNINGTPRDQAKLLVSRVIDGERETVYSAGAGIVAQIRRMSDDDRRALPMEVRLDQVPSKQGNPTHVLTPAGAPEPAQGALGDDDIPF